VLFQVKRQVRSLTALENGAERIGIDLNSIEKSHNIRMVQYLVYTILSNCVLHVVFLSSSVPLRIEFVYLYSYLAQVLDIVGFIYLTETTFPEQA
jgi:hypothetical protein